MTNAELIIWRNTVAAPADEGRRKGDKSEELWCIGIQDDKHKRKEKRGDFCPWSIEDLVGDRVGGNLAIEFVSY